VDAQVLALSPEARAISSARVRSIFLLLFLLFGISATFSQTGDFTIVLFPDTQNEAQCYPQVLASQTKW
jgi:hypothetical protein